MRVLAITCGSWSLKFRLSEASGGAADAEVRLAWGSVEGMGSRAMVNLATVEGSTVREVADVADHGAAVGRMLGWLGERGLAETIEAVGYREEATALDGRGPAEGVIF